MSKLPPINCNGCTKCCRGETIPLTPHDNPLAYKTTMLPNGTRVLAKDAFGNCVYLTAKGCSIYTKQPYTCRIFDCRLYVRAIDKLPYDERQKRLNNPQQALVLEEGKKRLSDG